MPLSRNKLYQLLTAKNYGKYNSLFLVNCLLHAKFHVCWFSSLHIKADDISILNLFNFLLTLNFWIPSHVWTILLIMLKYLWMVSTVTFNSSLLSDDLWPKSDLSWRSWSLESSFFFFKNQWYLVHSEADYKPPSTGWFWQHDGWVWIPGTSMSQKSYLLIFASMIY